MNLEIERRFLVDTSRFRFPAKKKYIRQAYLIFDKDQVLRVRNIDNSFFLTYKFKQSNINRLEFEYSIPNEDGEKLFSLSKNYLIEKDRYYQKIDSHTWEIDVFYGKNEGLMIAEIELGSEDEKINFPNWIGEEISNSEKYLNFNLSVNPVCLW